MPAAFYHLVVVRLFRPDVAESGTAARDVHHQRRKFAARKVADSLLFEADSQPRTGGHAAPAVGGGSHDHVDGGDFALRLEEGSSELRETARRGVGDFAGRSDRIAEETFTARQQRAVDDGLVAFEQDPVGVFHGFTHLSLRFQRW
ncbi:hypothetical protein SDC9_178139 [bioreactor metagenome]|uniref:Uncharacterized protein n=1 Tax=bioreactor metagenome TaxID=1076179 RepID=A0A645GUZ3_9ZZZZ